MMHANPASHLSDGMPVPPPPMKSMDQGRGPEDGDHSRDESGELSSGKRKYSDREPESPGQIDHDEHSAPNPKKERTSFFGDLDTDSPASYPKHVIVPAPDGDPIHDKHSVHPPHMSEELVLHESDPHASYPSEPPAHGGPQVLTPDSMSRGRYDGQYSRNGPGPYRDMYRAPSYTPEMDYGRSYGGGGSSQYHGSGPPSQGRGSDTYARGGDTYARGNDNYARGNDNYARGHDNYAPRGNDNFLRPRRWACDYCNVATFLSYEEACAHEEVCARRHQQHEPYPLDRCHPARPPPVNYAGPPPPHQQPTQGSGLGALYHASQEVVTPPTPHRHQPRSWGSHAPPLPVLPNEQGYYRQGYYDTREEPVHYNPEPHYQYHQQPPYHAGSYHGSTESQQKRMLLATSADRDSLSDRQCYVRAEMVEIFAATAKDVTARHSKGAQKLVVGQVGIRCVHCRHLRPRDRAERAVCYPSSISRIYQTVADMQRFHFEHCREIPDHVRQVYKKLKTTRPRGVGSPQTFWVSSANGLGLVDTEEGIQFENDMGKDNQQRSEGSQMSIGN